MRVTLRDQQGGRQVIHAYQEKPALLLQQPAALPRTFRCVMSSGHAGSELA